MDSPRLNRFCSGLRDLVAARRGKALWLLAPSARAGYQWLDALALSGTPVGNARVMTLRHMATDLASPVMAARGVTLLAGWREYVLVDRAFAALRSAGASYFKTVTPSRRLIDSLKATLRDLRLAGLTADTLSDDSFESPAKARDIRFLLETYERDLAASDRIDYADVLRLATERAAMPDEALLAYPSDLHHTALEETLLNAFPDDARESLPVDEPADENETSAPTDLARLRWIDIPERAPALMNDGTARIASAVGEINEVRAVFRYCAEKDIPLDRVELLYTDGGTYAPLVYEIALGLVEPGTEAPISLAEGVPCRYARPGRALAGWLAWMREGYPQAKLVQLIEGALVNVANNEAGIHAETASLLRSLMIGAGRERTGEMILRAERAARLRCERLESGDGLDEDTPDAIGHARERLARLRLLRDLVGELLDTCPAPDASAGETVAAAKRFLETRARTAGELDNYATIALVKQIDGLADALAAQDGDLALDVVDWLETLPDETPVMGEGPRPGKLYAAPITVGGHTLRPVTFILGLDDGRFPGAGMQDPLMLDRERECLGAAIGTVIPTAERCQSEKREAFVRLLARLRGQVTLSYSTTDLQQDSERLPAAVLLSSHRILSGDAEATQEDYLQSRPHPASFAPHRDAACLSEHDWWLWRLSEPDLVVNYEVLLHDRSPHLARGNLATAARLGPDFTAYDGHVPEAGRDLDPTAPDGPVLSPSALETYARCPMEFFIRYGLRVSPPEECIVDPSRWLDALQRGSLLHRVFHRVVKELDDAGITPVFDDALPRLSAILDEEIKRLADEAPPPSETVRHEEEAELRRAGEIFLRLEEAVRAAAKPFCLEAGIGLTPSETPTPLDSSEPVSVTLPSGAAVRVRGRVDRVDQSLTEPAAFGIVDYKTGSSRHYYSGGAFDNGRRVQNALYVPMVESRLRGLVPGARVSGFTYLFPTERAMGDRVGWSADELADGLIIVEQLCRGIASGCFPLPVKPADLDYSEYLPAFGNRFVLCPAVAGKLVNDANAMLQPLRELAADA